jgi:phosphoribosylamine--glycine ligase
MKVLVLGSGAREHALAHALARSSRCSEVLVAPGNAGMRDVARLLPVSLEDLPALVEAAHREGVKLTVAGSEEPLVRGVWDLFDAAGLRLLGPSAAAAALEGSKAFAKEFMRRHGIPTADFEVSDDFDAAMRASLRRGYPQVLKADGLAAGKGVHILTSAADAEASLRAMLVENQYGEAGHRVILEKQLSGPEISVFALCDGYNYRILGVAQDHKRAYDGDRGPNTGGMGAYSPVPSVGPEVLREVAARVLAPTLAGMVDEGTPYRGFLYAGLMLTSGGPQLLEYNCRLGDPEAQVLLPRIGSDFLELLLACDAGDVTEAEFQLDPGTALGVVVASSGYPNAPLVGMPVHGLEAARKLGASVYCAAVRAAGAGLVTSGGRVCTVVGRGADAAAARRGAYEAVAQVRIEGSFYRSDIGWRALPEAGAGQGTRLIH